MTAGRVDYDLFSLFQVSTQKHARQSSESCFLGTIVVEGFDQGLKLVAHHLGSAAALHQQLASKPAWTCFWNCVSRMPAYCASRISTTCQQQNLLHKIPMPPQDMHAPPPSPRPTRHAPPPLLHHQTRSLLADTAFSFLPPTCKESLQLGTLFTFWLHPLGAGAQPPLPLPGG